MTVHFDPLDADADEPQTYRADRFSELCDWLVLSGNDTDERLLDALSRMATTPAPKRTERS